MKGQDILLLLKLVCLSRLSASDILWPDAKPELNGWLDEKIKSIDEQLDVIDDVGVAEEKLSYLFTVRGLSEELGFSRSEVSNALKRCIDVNLAKINRINMKPEVNKKALFNFIQHGLRYVFPVKPAEVTRGIPTTFSAPVLQEKLLSAGELQMVWPDPRGKEMGQAVKPLYQSVPHAVRRDKALYAYLALLDAIRMGNARESNLALNILKEMFSHD